MTRLVAKSQIVVSYALLFGLIAALWSFAVVPYRDKLTDLEGRIAELRLRTEKMRHEVAKQGAQVNVGNEQSLGIDSILWMADTPAVAATQLQQAMSALIAQHSGLLNTSTIFDDQEARTVTVSLRFSSHIDDLRELLYVLESRRPFVFVDLLAVRLRDTYLRPVEPVNLAENVNPVLDVQLNATAHFVAGTGD